MSVYPAFTPSVFPLPSPVHQDLISQFRPALEARAARERGRGLLYVFAPRDEREPCELHFLPAGTLRASSVMALGLPEEAAHSIVFSVRNYDRAHHLAVLLVEETMTGPAEFAFLIPPISLPSE